MGDRVEGLAKVQYCHISLDTCVVGSREVLHGGEQLSLAGVSRSEAVVPVSQYAVFLQMVSEVATDDVLKQLAGYRCQ